MSQSILVQCPHCHSQGNLADTSLFGQPICCPMCQQIFVAPTLAETPPLVAATLPVPIVEITPAEAITELTTSTPPSDPVPAEVPDAAPASIDTLTYVPPVIPQPEPDVAADDSQQPAGEAIETAVCSDPNAALSMASESLLTDTSPASQSPSAEMPAVAESAQVAAAAVGLPVQSIASDTTPGALAPPSAVTPANLMTGIPVAGIPVATVPTAMIAGNPNASATVPSVATPAVWRFGAASPAVIATDANPQSLPVGIIHTVNPLPVAAIVVAAPAYTPVAHSLGTMFPPDAFAGIPSPPPPIVTSLEGPLPSFLAPPPAPGAAEVDFAQSLPEPVARGSIQPPIPQSKLMQTVIVGSISTIVLFATVMFLLGDPWRRWGKVKPPPEPDEMNPIARPFVPEPGESMEEVFARIKAQSQPASNDK